MAQHYFLQLDLPSTVRLYQCIIEKADEECGKAQFMLLLLAKGRVQDVVVLKKVEAAAEPGCKGRAEVSVSRQGPVTAVVSVDCRQEHCKGCSDRC